MSCLTYGKGGRSAMRSGAFWAGVLTGAAVGAVVALLYAPKPGPEVREDVAEGVRKIGDAASKRGRALLHRGRAKPDEAAGEEMTRSEESGA